MAIWKKTTAMALALMVTTSPMLATPAAAASNIFEENMTDQQLVGYAVYFWHASGANDRVVVRQINRYNGQVLVTWANGASSWVDGSNLYTEDQAKLADQQWNTGWGIVAVLGLAAVAGSGGSHSGSGSSSGGSDNRPADPPYRGNPSSPPPQSEPTPQSSGLYGNCHGGPLYGCPN